MPPPVVASAQIMCSFGTGPGNLMVIPQGPPVLIENKPAATVNDNIPFVNIMPFPTCIAPTNPAGMAKVPVPTPAPCIPVTTSPWVPPSPTTKINGKPALCMGSTLMCTAWAGVITIINPGTTKEIIN